MEKTQLIELRNVIEEINSKGITEDSIVGLDVLLNDNKVPLIFSGLNNKAASFNPNYKRILVNLKKTISWVDEMVKSSTEYFEVKDIELLKAYLLVYMYSHEVEHTNQFYIAMGLKKPNYEYKQQAFKHIFDVMIPKDYIIPRPITTIRDFIRFIRYNKNAYDYVLERNASVEGYDKAMQVALEAGDQEIYNYMLASRNTCMLIGYLDNGKGALLNTFEGLKMKREYDKLDIPSLSLTERAREGLEVSEDERKLVLSSLRENIKFKQ